MNPFNSLNSVFLQSLLNLAESYSPEQNCRGGRNVNEITSCVVITKLPGKVSTLFD